MRKLRKWEEEYMLYKNGTKEKRIKEIEEKLSNKTATKAEYDELKQIKKVNIINKYLTILFIYILLIYIISNM